MLKKILVLLVVGQGLLIASDAQLKGVDTVHSMSIELESQSDTYLNKIYQDSVVNTKVILDLYWANQCKSEIKALENFASKEIKSDQYYHFISLHLGSEQNSEYRYKDEITNIYTKNCDSTYLSLVE